MSARRDHTFFTDRDLGNQFPHILSSVGLKVERHRDRFAADCPDVEWLSAVGAKQWIAITHNSRIRYTPNELAAPRPHPLLARRCRLAGSKPGTRGS